MSHPRIYLIDTPRSEIVRYPCSHHMLHMDIISLRLSDMYIIRSISVFLPQEFAIEIHTLDDESESRWRLAGGVDFLSFSRTDIADDVDFLMSSM